MSSERAQHAMVMVVHSVFTATGGAEIQAARLGAALRSRGWAVTTVGLAPRERKARNHTAVSDPDMVLLHAPRVPGLAGLVLVLQFALYLILNRSKYSVIHVHIMKTLAFTAAVVGQALSKTVVLKVSGYDELDHGCLSERQAHSCYYRVLNWGCKKADTVIAISRQTQERLLACGYGEEQVVYLPNGIDLDRFRPCADKAACRRALKLSDANVAVFVGRFVHEKGLFNLVDAWRFVRQRFPNSLLCMVGDGQYRHSIETVVGADPLLKDAVYFAGETKGVETYLAAADCYVSASLTEGLSNTMLEAMASGLPIVCTRISGAEDMVQEDKNGYLVPVGGSEQLSGAVEKVFSDHARAAVMGRHSRTLAERLFDVNRIIDRYEQLYCAK